MQNKRSLDQQKLKAIQEGAKHAIAVNKQQNMVHNYTAPNSKGKFIRTAQSWAKGGAPTRGTEGTASTTTATMMMNTVSDFGAAKGPTAASGVVNHRAGYKTTGTGSFVDDFDD